MNRGLYFFLEYKILKIVNRGYDRIDLSVLRENLFSPFCNKSHISDYFNLYLSKIVKKLYKLNYIFANGSSFNKDGLFDYLYMPSLTKDGKEYLSNIDSGDTYILIDYVILEDNILSSINREISNKIKAGYELISSVKVEFNTISNQYVVQLKKELPISIIMVDDFLNKNGELDLCLENLKVSSF